ncbi:5-formyltetrahydrofolate cyclo-ligase [Roseateles oligotrophus]|uniref:5-formyltetrahydrofolate cyclo-ligase n=1 Tax=Roseateles oligotrophus TaxID=1769250 RepID=A0ABT2YHK8_9BURK|nr:5-formyltetrahydrofolate cyclo-ligase [Roseateles oligotrophus]MCV2369551.1 5-formyltetrahydrofolate cyclo-ligase [Roseateles oligotrophus]
MRTHLLAQRAAWVATPAAHAAAASLGHNLRVLLEQLEPQCLGLFWPLEGEFNAAEHLLGLLGHGNPGAQQDSLPIHAQTLGAEPDEDDLDDGGDVPAGPIQWALPFAYKAPRRMDYRRWDGSTPSVQDECGIGSSKGAVVVPDVVLVPCVGFTREGYRLGYGGGYYDRWLAAHPGVTSIGLAWSQGECHFAAEAHDQPLTLILTEHETISP